MPARKRRGQPPRPRVFGIPYFAHQQLDPGRFPTAVGAPLKRSPALEKLLRERNTRRKVKTEEKLKAHPEDDEFEDENIANNSDDDEPLAVLAVPEVTDLAPIIKIEPEDELIRRLKEAGYTDKAVAKHVAEQTNAIYQSKQIANRWTRLRRTLGVHNDEMLKAGLTGWHDGDDEILHQAMSFAERDEQEAIARAKAKKWQRVADHMKNLKPVTNFSPRACESRASAISNGTADPTPESLTTLDPRILAQIQRRKEQEACIEADKALKPSMFKAEQEVDEKQQCD